MSKFRLPSPHIGARKFAARRSLAFVAAVLGLTLASSTLVVAPAAAADTSPTTVSADPLPTVQINGVAWAQAARGNTVYVGGQFTNARPAGAAAGTSLTTRTNLLAYNLTTGVLDTSWNPGTNGKVLTMAVSPDGSRLYIGGTFQTVAGQSRLNAAAFDTATGALTSWRPTSNGTVSGIAATNSTVYMTGSFSAVNSTERLRIAAVSASTAALVPTFAPRLEGGYGGRAVVIAPDASKVVVAGSFTSTNGSTTVNQGRGIAALGATSGALLQWKMSAVLRNATQFAAMYSLSSDGDSVYGTGYDYGGSNADGFEGAFRASWSDGTLQWMEDCHGDTYSTVPLDGVLYSASHAHYCGNVPGGFPQESPWRFNHSLAWSKEPAGTTITKDPLGYRNFAGNPAGKLLHWYPIWSPGSFTGANQAAWDVRASGDYLLFGGEFTRVAGLNQQGLVRFAKRTIAPKKMGPEIKGGNYKISPASFVSGTARVAWPANHDTDSAELTYQLFRQGVTAPLYTTKMTSTYWVRPSMMYMDTSVTGGQTYNYRVRVTDPDGNTQQSDWTPVTIATTGSATAYNSKVLQDSPTSYWPLNEASGTLGYDWSTGKDLTLSSTGITRGITGPNLAQASKATGFAGTSTAIGSTRGAVAAPQSFSVEAWFRTTSNTGGKIIGFGDRTTGNSSNYDRHIYLSNAGAVTFGVHPGAVRTITSGAGFNDGKWHYVVGTLGSSGMAMYLDGKRIGTRADTTSAQVYNGYWRVGGDNTGGWTSTGSSHYLNGSIADVAVYNNRVFSSEDVDAHWVSSGRTSVLGGNVLPVASFSLTQAPNSGAAVSVNGSGSTDSDGSIATYAWNFGDGATATGATASHTYSASGDFTIRLTVADNRGGTNSTTKPVRVVVPPPSEAVLAQDDFGRTVAAGSWGAADKGGSWTLWGGSTEFSVASGVGRVVSPIGGTREARLTGVSGTDALVAVSVTTDVVPTTAANVTVIGRRVSTSYYGARARLEAGGLVRLYLLRDEISLGSMVVPGTYTPGTVINLKVAVSGTSPTTIKGKAWFANTTEPSGWMREATDTTAAMQAAGYVALRSSTSSTAGAAVNFRYDGYRVTTVG